MGTTNGVVVAVSDEEKAFDPSKVDARYMDAQALVLKANPYDKKKNPEGRARDLISFFRRTTKTEALVDCSHCSGPSPGVLESCPFCKFAGDSAEEDPDALTRADSRPEPTTAIVKVAPAKASFISGRASETDLDARVARITVLKTAGAVALWELGNELNRMKDEGLWMLRLNELGTKQRWNSFEAFCHAELLMTPGNARELMRTSRNYTRDLVTQFGTKKLLLALQAPPEDRKRLEEQIKAGASKRDIEKAVRSANATRETTVRSDTGNTVPKGGHKAMPAEERADTGNSKAQKKITVANIVGAQRVKLFKKASMDMKNPDPKAGTRAKKLGDVPWGWMQLQPGVVMQFTVVPSGAGGELELRVNTRRVEDE